MHIKALRIKNYKSFWDSEEIPFEQGFNLIVGQNDAGKTALLEALRPGMEPRPHRSLLTAPDSDSPAIPSSLSAKKLVISAEDVRRCLSRVQQVGLVGESPAAARIFFELVLGGGCEVLATWRDHQLITVEILFPSPPHMSAPYVHVNAAWPRDIAVGDHQSNGGTTFYFELVQLLSADIYAFGAERFNMGVSAANGNRVLLSNASNLPEVLNKLTENPAVYEELLSHMKTVFPHITHVTAAIENAHLAHIRIWTHPVLSKRYDLAIGLSDSGNGIGQVLAMLYVAVTAEKPKVILIDEPQSFLHPGAVRKLFEILAAYSHHQYVITTHSPGGLNIGDATNMLMVKRGVDQSNVIQLNPLIQKDVGFFLAEVGARLGDVFGADNVLWVEGKTEEICFPILLRDVAKKSLQGTQVLGLVNTGDLESGFADRVVDIYLRLTKGASVLPPAVAFILDTEGRTDIERNDVSRRAKGLVRWLPRRMYENYLIDPEAISQLVNSEDETRPELLTAAEVSAWLSEHGSAKKYFLKHEKASHYGSETWLSNVHGGRVLHDLFEELSNLRIRYDKVKHGEALTKSLSISPSESFIELATFISECSTV